MNQSERIDDLILQARTDHTQAGTDGVKAQIEQMIVEAQIEVLDRVYVVYKTPSKESGYLGLEHIIEHAKADLKAQLNQPKEE